MWLLDTATLELHEFFGDNVPPYAILSHTWSDAEVLFHEVKDNPIDDKVKRKQGFEKMSRFCALAREQGHSFAWVDSCCIDKRSSAELSEAINSMYTWYKQAQICVIYLADVPSFHGLNEDLKNPALHTAFEESRWFTRGWTLQELIAPRHRVYVSQDWTLMQENENVLYMISKVTKINIKMLQDSTNLDEFCIAERMSWASKRETTRHEDVAYSLMGLFGVNMPILYGEGLQNAFMRLQEEIMKASFDQTIFAWRGPYESSGLLAHKPADFENTPILGLWRPKMLAPSTMTNIGLHIRPVIARSPPSSHPDSNKILAALQCDIGTPAGYQCLAIWLEHIKDAYCWVNGERCSAYRRVRCDKWMIIPILTGCQYEQLLVLEDRHYHMVQKSMEEDEARQGLSRKDDRGQDDGSFLGYLRRNFGWI